MSAKRKPSGMTKQHAECLGEVLSWLSAQHDATPLEIGVLEEIRDRVSAYAHRAAIVRIRVKNLGATPSERRRRVWRDGRAELSDAELHEVQRLFAAGVTLEAIGERLGRSYSTVRQVTARLGLERIKPTPHHIIQPHQTPLQRARRVMEERRRREAEVRSSG